MNASTDEVAFGDSRNNNESRLSASFGAGFGQDVSVPVYATIKGVSPVELRLFRRGLELVTFCPCNAVCHNFRLLEEKKAFDDQRFDSSPRSIDH